MIALRRRPVLATLKIAGDLDACVCQAVAAPTDAPALLVDDQIETDIRWLKNVLRGPSGGTPTRSPTLPDAAPGSHWDPPGPRPLGASLEPAWRRMVIPTGSPKNPLPQPSPVLVRPRRFSLEDDDDSEDEEPR